jgi:hypothetical protein
LRFVIESTPQAEAGSVFVSWFILLTCVMALGLGIWVGLGAPGIKGREDRVVAPGRARRLKPKHLDWLKPRR